MGQLCTSFMHKKRGFESTVWVLRTIQDLRTKSGAKLIRDFRSHKPFTVLQQFRPKFQPAHMLGLNT
ncbi:MAG: hypothetical protein M3Z37_08350, partial [Candidatus Eremiobacteraeota bacterium]|nr:hypothetical protein [Candidatus Eremiobacteraeota bacterium]